MHNLGRHTCGVALTPRWDWAPLFLLALGRSGLVRASARACGTGRRTVYDRRERDLEFAANWDAVLEPFRRGDRRFDRGALAAFPAHRALAPLEKMSAQIGAVSVAELEAALGYSLDELAEKYGRVGGRDRGTRAVAVRFSDEIRALAAASRARTRARGENPGKQTETCAVSGLRTIER